MNNQANRRRRWPWIITALLLVAAIAAAALLLSGNTPELLTPGSPTPAAGEVATAFIGDLASSATASGQVEAIHEARLALATSGTVEAVTVEVGDSVEAGEALVILDDAALERAVVQAEQTLAIQDANLEALRAGASQSDLDAAEAAVASAQANLEDVLDGPSEEEIAQAEANLRAAQSNLAAASNRLGETQAPADQAALLQAQRRVEDAEQAVLDAERAHQRTLDCEQLESGEWDCEPAFDEDLSNQLALQVVQARENLAAAQAELESVQQGADPNTVGVSQANVASMAAQRDAAAANLELLQAGPTEAEVAAARASLADAEANLAGLRAGPSAAQLAAAEAQAEQARIALQRARNNQEDAVLRAPFAAVVTAVHVEVGEVASGTAVDLVDLSSLEVVLDVDEVDIGQLAVGQSAVLTLQAWPEEEIESEIVAIGPAANSLLLDNSIATYPVHLTLSQSERPLRVGMTADARLLTSQREDVLLVPNRAVTIDRQAGRYFVNRVTTGAAGDETVEQVEVTVGLRDDQYTQITGGLDEGDRVQIGPIRLPDENPFEENGGRRGGGGPFGG